jgi:hypothetical protein
MGGDGTSGGVDVPAIASVGVALASSALPHQDAIQRSFGKHDVSAVRAQVGGEAAEAAGAIGAQAYATGNRVAFAREPSLHTAAHEAAHVIQQRGGVQLKGGVGASGDAYERHADAIAERVVVGESAEALIDPHTEGDAPAMGADDRHRVVQRREQNGPYTGNRPNPSSATTTTYAIRSSASRVMRVGDRVDYHIEQLQATIASGGSHLSTRWQVINDPASVAAGSVPAIVDGPRDALSWSNLTARVAGVHTIKAWVSIGDQPLGELTFQQQVVAINRGPVLVPANATASPLATMQDFIALTRRIEAAYNGRPWQDVVSRIRREYYPGPGGGAYSGILDSFTWDDLIDEQESMPGLEVPPVAMADVAAIRRTQVVVTAAGIAVDIGHILTGVDSFNFPGVAGIFAAHDMEGPAAATWSGDVGSALVHWAVDAPLSDTTPATKLRFYDSFASSSDMIGDVDALALAHGPNLTLPANAPLSRRLEAFYQTAPATGENRRFHNFCRASHFGLTSNALDAAAQARIRDQIVRFARGFNVKGSIIDGLILGGGGGMSRPSDLENTTGGRIEREGTWFADHFVAWVNAGLAAEGSH